MICVSKFIFLSSYVSKLPKFHPRLYFKLGCVFPMVIVSILPHAEFGWNGHQERAPHFILRGCNCVGVTMWSGLKFLAEWFSAFLSVRYSDLNFPDRYLQHATSIIFWIIEPKSSLLDKKNFICKNLVQLSMLKILADRKSILSVEIR